MGQFQFLISLILSKRIEIENQLPNVDFSIPIPRRWDDDHVLRSPVNCCGCDLSPPLCWNRQFPHVSSSAADITIYFRMFRVVRRRSQSISACLDQCSGDCNIFPYVSSRAEEVTIYFHQLQSVERGSAYIAIALLVCLSICY